MPDAKKPWLESDERKKLIDSLPETDREAADAWDREQEVKSRIAKARQEYETPPRKRSKWGSD